MKEQLAIAEEEVSRTRVSSREVTDLARKWEEDYRQLSKDYEEALRSRGSFEEKVRIEQA